jgi:hypothetical protein
LLIDAFKNRCTITYGLREKPVSLIEPDKM